MGKKYTISGYYGFNNFGDELILSVLCKKLKAENADITVFSVSPTETSQKYGVKASPTFNILKVIKVLSETDVLISGGGSLFQDTTSLKSLLYYAFVLFTAQLFKKETIIYRQGIGPLNKSISGFIVKKLFKKCNYISVRDEKSLKILSDYGIKAEIKDDPVWEIELPKADKTNAIGVQLRECSGMGDDFLKNLALAISKTNPPEIKLFILQKKMDYEISNKFKDFMSEISPNLKITIVDNDLLKELSSVKTLVAARYHALIIGLKSGTKCIGINYDPKIKALAEKYSVSIIELSNIANEINLF